MSVATASPEEMPSVHTRKNGKLQACEPCRKGKLRCDHARPTCARCRMRGRLDQCVYHPAPMTRRFAGSATARPGNARGSIGSTSPTATPTRFAHAGPPSPSRTNTQEFFGATSHAALFPENQQGPSIPAESLDHHHGSSWRRFPGLPGLDSQQIEEGASILSIFSNLALFEQLIDSRVQGSHDSILLPQFLKPALAAVRLLYGDILIIPDNHDFRLDLSRKVFRSSLRPLRICSSLTAPAYTALFTGHNLRWEMVGIVFALAGISALRLPARSSILAECEERFNNKATFAYQMIKASNRCLAFCNQGSHLNDLLLWLMQKNLLLLTMVHGDSNYLAWRRLGDLSTAVFAMGLHQEINTDGDVPFFLAELRKRTFAAIYSADKDVATFLGRPPRISHRYCNPQLPLDLEFRQVVAEGSDLQLLSDKFDEKGWNRDGVLSWATFARARLLMSFIREDVLELSLGSSVTDLQQRSREISLRLEQTWKELPDCTHYKPICWRTSQSPAECFASLLIYLDYLFNEFLLQRTLQKCVGTRPDSLFTTAAQVLSAILIINIERSRLMEFQCDLSWPISFYGLSCAGVLAVELLRQKHHSQEIQPSLSRADTIQNLSVFNSCLDWVSQEGDGNALLCAQARLKLKSILDDVLSPKPIPAPNVVPFEAVPENEMGFLSWVDDVDLDLNSWSYLN